MKQISMKVDERLYAHLGAMKILLGELEGRKVTLAELVRRAVKQHYKYGKIQCAVNEPIIEALMLNE